MTEMNDMGKRADPETEQQGESSDRDSESGLSIEGHPPALVTRFRMRHIATMVFGNLFVAHSV